MIPDDDEGVGRELMGDHKAEKRVVLCPDSYGTHDKHAVTLHEPDAEPAETMSCPTREGEAMGHYNLTIIVMATSDFSAI